MSIKISERNRKITVSIDGEDYVLLERAARAINTCSWSDDDNSALTVFRAYVWSWVNDYFVEDGAMAANVIDGIATADGGLIDAKPPIHKKRIAELRAAFEAEGLLAKRSKV